MGFAEAVVVLVIAVPVLALVWALATLGRIYRHQTQLPAPPGGGNGPDETMLVVTPRAETRSSDEKTTILGKGVAEGALQAGAIVESRYRIDRLVGSGGMGSVYRAWDLELEAPVALKVIRPDLSGDPAKLSVFTRRFKQELQLARRVTHRNVLRIHDIGEIGGVKYITMPYVEGGDLTNLLSGRPLAIGRALRLGRQIVEGLSAAHEVGIVHRDLKPQNILVDRDDHVYLSDFGLAKSLANMSANLAQSGEQFFTPRYVTPEQIEGKPADQRSDVYAVGLILYEMFTGAAPFSTVLSRLSELPKQPNEFSPDIPARVNRIVMRCLQREPEFRYRNAQDLVADWSTVRYEGSGGELG